MTKTAKERIEEEIKDVNRSLVYSLNKNERAFNSGKRQGLTIALAHIQNATTIVTSNETVMIDKEVYDLLINKVNKQREQLATAVEALEDINDCTWHSKNRGIVVDTSDKGTVNLFDFTEKALAEIGGKDD